MAADDLPGQMRSAATALLGRLDARQRARAERPLDDAGRRTLEYRPRAHPGACLADLGTDARKAAHRLLSTALSDHAYAQAMTVVALEEVLDRAEGWQRGRHSGDYWVAVFGTPGTDTPWSWRVEGHHLSVNVTVAGAEVRAAPVFFGANPARVCYAGQPVSRPLGPEEDLARGLLDALGPAGRARAVVSDQPPGDIYSSTRREAQQHLTPLGVRAADLGPTARALLDALVAAYTDRLSPALAAGTAARAAGGGLHFAWEGPLRPGTRHYYRVQGDDLLIEYDNTADDGNHVHTVLRHPRADFGEDLLAAHYRAAHT
jgi:hypothetical protein